MDAVTVKSSRSATKLLSEESSTDGGLNLRTTSGAHATVNGPIAAPEVAEKSLESIIGIFKDEPIMETLMESIRENRRLEIEAGASE